MSDPLTEVISLLQPRTVLSKGITGSGAWAVRYSDFGHPSFCAVLKGSCILRLDGQPEITLREGDFVLLPATPGFTMSALPKHGSLPATPKLIDPASAAQVNGEVHHGSADESVNARLLGGYFEFGSPDAGLLVSLMPAVVHIRDNQKLTALVNLVNDECRNRQAGHDLVLSRLVDVLLVEALRSTSTDDAPPGLLRGLADKRVALAIREIHRDPARSWTVAAMAKISALSRTSFFERFAAAVGLLPMEYLLTWRMAIAKDLLRRFDIGLAEVAERIGYGSASAFSTAFSRYVGLSPSHFARQHRISLTKP